LHIDLIGDSMEHVTTEKNHGNSQYRKELRSNRNIDNVKAIKAKPTVWTVGLEETSDSLHETEDGNKDTSILADVSNLYKQRNTSVSTSKKFIKYIPSEKSAWLRSYHTSVYLLLSLAIERARWEENESLDGLLPGDAILGSYKEAGLTRQQYRTAIKKGEELGIWEIVYNRKNHNINHTKTRNVQKSTIKRTIKRTIKSIVVNIKGSDIWDLNIKNENHQNNHDINHELTMSQPSANHKQDSKDSKDSKDKELFCIAQPGVVQNEKSFQEKKLNQGIKTIKKRHVNGHEVEVFFDDIIKKAISANKNWTLEEINEAWQILINYAGLIRDGWLFIEGTMKNIKNKKTQNFLKKGKKCQENQEIKEKSKSEKSNEIILEDVSKERPSLQSLLDKALMQKKLSIG
jgi:hypothetical protein